MNIGDRVTYAKTRETQDVQPDRRNSVGAVVELAEIDGYTCAKVIWDWASPGLWVRIHRLEVVATEQGKAAKQALNQKENLL